MNGRWPPSGSVAWELNGDSSLAWRRMASGGGDSLTGGRR
jgi:hypothetical protein